MAPRKIYTYLTSEFDSDN